MITVPMLPIYMKTVIFYDSRHLLFSRFMRHSYTLLLFDVILLQFLFIYIMIGYKCNIHTLHIQERKVLTMFVACIIIALLYLFISFASYRAFTNVYLRIGLGMILGLMPLVVFVHFEWWFILCSLTLTILMMLVPNIMRRT